jgi:hypothetical protein
MARMCTKAELLALAEAGFEPVSPDDIAIASCKILMIQRKLKQEMPEAVWAPWEQ